MKDTVKNKQKGKPQNRKNSWYVYPTKDLYPDHIKAIFPEHLFELINKKTKTWRKNGHSIWTHISQKRKNSQYAHKTMFNIYISNYLEAGLGLLVTKGQDRIWGETSMSYDFQLVWWLHRCASISQNHPTVHVKWVHLILNSIAKSDFLKKHHKTRQLNVKKGRKSSQGGKRKFRTGHHLKCYWPHLLLQPLQQWLGLCSLWQALHSWTPRASHLSLCSVLLLLAFSDTLNQVGTNSFSI